MPSEAIHFVDGQVPAAGVEAGKHEQRGNEGGQRGGERHAMQPFLFARHQHDEQRAEKRAGR